MSEKKILRLHDVMVMVGVRKTTIYAWVKRGEFPAPVRLGARAVGWRESEIGDWLASRIPAGTKAGDIADDIAVKA
ncbi:AlpA family transcriptional regulator [Paraburkholderia sp. J7]|uniref:helix-turn-helix transcriptional regulator n=1 Tax=Paraburkholderia sp. J7 TaxID=2805438 RepID=UPI002AB61439|nr:AlpA family transcriptional regulator [Paraburkholderia sp. J7]